MTDFQWGLCAGASIISLLGLVILLIFLLLNEDKMAEETDEDAKIEKSTSVLTNSELDALLKKDLVAGTKPTEHS